MIPTHAQVTSQGMIEADRLPTLTSERLSLRWLDDDDAPAIFEIFSHPEIARYWSSPAYTELREASASIAKVHQQFRDHRCYQWGLVLGETGQLVGTCTLVGLDAQNRRAEVGFALSHAHWRRGYMREALTLLIGFAFDDLALHRLEADVDPRNAASLRLLESLGFQREGYLRQRWIVGGEINDTVFLGLLGSEWQGREQPAGRQK